METWCFFYHCNLVDNCVPPPSGRFDFSFLSESSRIEEVITTIVYPGLGFLLLHLHRVLVFIQVCLFNRPGLARVVLQTPALNKWRFVEISSEHLYSQTVRIREPNQIFIDFDPTISKQKAAYDARSTFNFFYQLFCC